MANTTWMNFGGIRLTDGVNVVDFTGASGRIKFKPDQSILESDNGHKESRLWGYWPFMTTDKMYTLQDDAAQVTFTKQLAAMLSNLVLSSAQNVVTVYPRYDPDEPVNISYDCILASDVSPEDIARVECGTVIGLSWEAVDRVDTIPSIFSGETVNQLADESGNLLADEGGLHLADKG
jgi:hypothetical protein